MSSRVLKKLQGENTIIVNDEEDHSDIEIDLGATSKIKQLNINRYDLLNQQSPSESEVKEDDNETEYTSAVSNTTLYAISKKKKKKRKKKSTKYTSNQISSEDNEISDKLINELDKVIGKNLKGRIHENDTRLETNKQLLKIDPKNLNPHYEMRRTFGKRVVKIECKRGRGQKPTLKSTYIINPKEGWPAISKDIIFMSISSPPEGVTQSKNIVWYCFEHYKSYQNLQNMFLSAVETMDSDFLIKIMRKCPYHIDSLIQLSELCKMTENFSMASELIERAILILESSLHPTFSLLSGNCRLDYKKQENRAFFIVLFKYAQYLEGRACCRTAFEISKLILSLNPETDPLAMVLVIDYYALRSKQYFWLIQFYDECEKTRNLSQLPNMAYSYALSLFYLKKDLPRADEALQYALLMFPGVLKPLLEELSVQSDGRFMGHHYFNNVNDSQTPALNQLILLYICRAKIIWRDPLLLPWLEKNVHIVLDKVDKKDEIVHEYKLKRNQRYINPPRAILRHVVLADFKEKVPLSPFITKEKNPILMYDPLPPLDSVNSYEGKPTSESTITTASPVFSMFFQSLLPNVNLDELNSTPETQGGLNPNQNEDGAIAPDNEGQSYRELRSSLNSLVNAMRDFLSNIGISERSNIDGGDGNETSDENTSDNFD